MYEVFIDFITASSTVACSTFTEGIFNETALFQENKISSRACLTYVGDTCPSLTQFDDRTVSSLLQLIHGPSASYAGDQLLKWKKTKWLVHYFFPRGCSERAYQSIPSAPIPLRHLTRG